MAQKDLTFDIIARDKASQVTGKISGGFSKLGATTTGVFAGIGATLGHFAVRQLGAAARAVADFVVDSVKEFSAFDRSMREVWTLLPDLSAPAFKAMQGDVRTFVKEMGVAHDEAVPALYQAISAGVPQENVFDFLTTAAKFSIGGVTSLETAVDGLTSVTNAYGREALSAEKASDIFFTTVRLGKTTAGELSQSLFQVIPTAAALGVEFETVGAALAALTAQGVPTAVATTQIRQMFVELNKEGGKTAGLFDDLTGKSFANFIAGGGTVQQALQLMAEHADDNNTSLSNLFGSVEAGNAALALTSEGGAKAFNAALGEMADASGATDEAFGKMDEGMGRTWDKLMVRIDDLKIGLGERLAPAIEGVLDWFEQFASGSEDLEESLGNLGDTTETQISGRIVPELERLADTWQTTMVENESSLKELTKAVGILITGQLAWLGLLMKALVAQKEVTAVVLKVMANAFIMHAELILNAAIKAFGWVPGLGDKLRQARDKVKGFREDVNRQLDRIRRNVNVNVHTSFSSSGTPPGGRANAPVMFQQHGGEIPGPFTGIDRVPAMLTAGEFVVRRDQAQRHLSLLRAINSGQVGSMQRFARGGTVQDAARQMLRALSGGGSFFEDFSFRGASGTVKRFNDILAERFYGGGGRFNRGQISRFLRRIADTEPRRTATIRPSSAPAPREPIVFRSDGTKVGELLIALFREAIRTNPTLRRELANLVRA